MKRKRSSMLRVPRATSVLGVVAAVVLVAGLSVSSAQVQPFWALVEGHIVNTNSGSVGVGLTNPPTRFAVKASGQDDGISLLNSSGANIAQIKQEAGDGRLGLGRGVGGPFPISFWAGGDSYIYAGNFGLGTYTPAAKLDVNGTVRAKEIVVESGSWPDFVFEADYELAALTEVRTFVEQHKHLPGIPSNREVQENDISIGHAQASTLEHIERVHLYLFELNDRLGQLEEENRALTTRLAVVEGRPAP